MCRLLQEWLDILYQITLGQSEGNLKIYFKFASVYFTVKNDSNMQMKWLREKMFLDIKTILRVFLWGCDYVVQLKPI